MNKIHYSIKGAFRIVQTFRVLTQTGLNWIRGERPASPEILRKTFEQLGATYIKLGQFIASSPSLFPSEYIKEFELCLDRTEPLPFSAMSKVLERELRKPLEEIFSYIDPKPLASASIAQVHAGQLLSGEEVAIKIQKPGVKDVLLTDLNFLYLGAKLLELLQPRLTWISLSEMVSEIQQAMSEECDFLKEADHIGQFNKFLFRTGNDRVVVPKVYPQATTACVLTMERFYGAPITDLDSIRQYCNDPEDILITAMNTWFTSLLFCDFFHADVHAGNLMILQDGRIGFIDFGIVGRVSPKTWGAIFSLMTAIEQSDFHGVAKAMITIGITKQKINRASLAEDLATLFQRSQELQPTEQEISGFVLAIITVGERYGLHFPREFTLLLKQFLYFDRYIQLLAPELNPLSEGRILPFPVDLKE